MSTLAVFTDVEKVKIRHHLGYMNAADAFTFVLGVPAAVQTQFQIEGAMAHLLSQAYELARKIICRLDALENEFYCGAGDFASVESIDSIKMNKDRRKEMGGYYRNARAELANMFGTVPNPWDQREIVMGPALNVPVY